MATRPRHRLRQSLGAVADALPGRFYGAYALDPAEFVGTIDADLDRAIELLRGAGYAYTLVAATKRHPDDGRVDDGSYRRRDPGDTEKQWHVHLYTGGEDGGPSPDGTGPIEVYSHYEYTPLWPPSPTRSREHYWPEWGSTYLRGQHCERLRESLADHGEYAGDPDRVGSAGLAPY